MGIIVVGVLMAAAALYKQGYVNGSERGRYRWLREMMDRVYVERVANHIRGYV
jgi:hypothetical protein